MARHGVAGEVAVKHCPLGRDGPRRCTTRAKSQARGTNRPPGTKGPVQAEQGGGEQAHHAERL